MRRLPLFCALLWLATARPAAADLFGQMGEARPLTVDGRLAGAYLQFDKSSISLLGQLRLSFYPNVDFGFQGGLSRIDVGGTSRTSVRLGGDFKVLVASPSPTLPLALSLGGVLGIETADSFTSLSLGPRVMGTWVLRDSSAWVPYAGATLLYSRLDVGDQSKTDLSLPLRAGIDFRALQDLHLLAELQLNVSDEIRDDVQFTVGANFPF